MNSTALLHGKHKSFVGQAKTDEKEKRGGFEKNDI